MVRRLVLGCGSIGHAVVVTLARGGGDLSVVDPDPDRVETLRNEGVPARQGAPGNAGDVSVDGPIDTVLVAGDDPDRNLTASETAREVYPDASLVVYTGVGSTPDQGAAIEAVADRVVDGGSAITGQILETVETAQGRRHHELLATIRGVSGRLGVFTHDNPDPDAIASAVALRDLALAVGTEAEACYFGDISHQENRALVNVLDLDLRDLDGDAFDPGEYDAFALVDHSRPGVNDQLPEDLAVDVVIDHHPPRGAVGGRFVDLRDDVGATSTLLTGYYRTLGADMGTSVATALLYGIRVDTRDFGRGITEADFDAVATLVEHADFEALGRIENPSVTGEMLSVLARAIANRQVRGSVLATAAGWTSDRDALAQAADTLLGMEGVTIVLVLGIMEDTETVVASARTRQTIVDVGEALRLAYDQIGSAGGHTDMAGAQIPLGILGSIEDESGSLEEIIGDVLLDRFFEVMEDFGVVEASDARDADSADGVADGADESAGRGEDHEENDFSPRDPST